MSDLVGNPEDWFSRVTAHMIMAIQLKYSIIGNGYCRSEGIVAIYLQKESMAKRIYCTVVHSKNNSDGNKTQGNVLISYS